MRRVATLAALVLTLTATRSDPLAGRVAGPPRECVDLQRLQGPAVEDAGTIVYHESGRRLWVTHAIGPCPALRPITTLIVDVYGAQLCRNDRFRVLEPNANIPSGICRFDRFTPYDKVDSSRN